MRTISILLAAAVTGCCTPTPLSTLRFANQAPVTVVNDRRDVPTAPREKPFYRNFYHFNSYYIRGVRGLRLEKTPRALGVNALDEVPDSTFFTNRLGVRTVTPAEIRRGPTAVDSPEQHRPWKILSTKEGGKAIGFLAEDAAGTKFLLKFDKTVAPELETGADAVTSRLWWAAGWYASTDHVVFFRRDEITIAPDAYSKDGETKRPLRDADVDAKLALTALAPDGRYRALASILVDGEPLGGMPRIGVRDDDPNDRIPHERRRDQRGQAAFAAWLAHSDMKEDNTLDVYQEDPVDPKVHYVTHYMVDFGKSLGAYPRVQHRWYPDKQHDIDPGEWGLSFITLGLHRQPWEGRTNPEVHGIGLYSDDDYEPDHFKAATMAQLPVVWADRFDHFWGAKLMMKLTREQLAAAVDAGRYSDPQASAYLLETLIKRQRHTARFWFERVNPIDDVAIERGERTYRLCFTDLALHYGLETAPTTFAITAYSASGAPTDLRQRVAPGADGRACLPDLGLAADNADGYTIFVVENSRGQPPTLLHVANAPGTRVPQVIGIERR